MSELHTISAETGHEQQTRVPVTAKALLDMRFPFDANLSPDGKRVAFVVWERVEDKPKRRGNIWVVDTSVGEARPFSKRKNEEFCPRWSPNSAQLAFISKGEGEKDKPQLFVMPAEGGEAKQVCAMPNGALTTLVCAIYIRKRSLYERHAVRTEQHHSGRKNKEEFRV